MCHRITNTATRAPFTDSARISLKELFSSTLRINFLAFFIYVYFEWKVVSLFIQVHLAIVL